MTARVTMWANPSCSKSRGATALLAELGVDVDEVLYLHTPPSREEIERVLRLLGSDDPGILLRTSEPLSRELGLATAPRDAVLEALATHPELIERPVVICGERAVIARPPELLLTVLGEEEHGP